MAERNCLLLDSCLDKFYIACFKFGCFFSFLFFSFFFPGCSLFEVLFNFGLSGFRPRFAIFSLVIYYAQLLPRLVSVPVGQPPLLGSYWPFVFHPSVDIMPCAFRPAYIGLK